MSHFQYGDSHTWTSRYLSSQPSVATRPAYPPPAGRFGVSWLIVAPKIPRNNFPAACVLLVD